MRTVTGRATRLVQGILAIGAMLAPVDAAAFTSPARVSVVHRPENRQWIVSIALPDSSAASAERRLVLSVQVPGLHFRFLGQLVDRTSQPLGSEFLWGATLFAAPSDPQSWREAPATARLSSGAPEVRIARPYGLPLAVGESMTIVAALPVDAPAGSVLRIIIEYESVPASRFAAIPVASEETVATDSWTFRAEVPGKLVVVSGRQLADAETLVLEDITTGVEIWRLPPRLDRVAIVRLSVPVEGGRLYRLRATYGASAEQAHGGDTPIALVSPSGAGYGALLGGR